MDLIIGFTDKSESFVNGVEYGRLLVRMERGEDIVENGGFPVHRANEAVIRDTCRYYGYTPMFKDIAGFEEWVNFTAIRNRGSDN